MALKDELILFIQTELIKRTQDIGLTETDITVENDSIVLSPEAKQYIPFDFNCADKTRFDIWKFIEQTKPIDKDDFIHSLMIFKKEDGDIYCSLKFNELLDIIYGSYYEDLQTNKFNEKNDTEIDKV